MTANSADRLLVTVEQMERLLRALDDLRSNVLPQNPQLFAVMCEGPLEDLSRLRNELHGFVVQLRPSA